MSISALDRAIDIIELLYTRGNEMGVSDISKELSIPKSTTHRTLETLQHRGFVQKNQVTDKYWLGIKLYTIGSFVGETLSISKIVQPYANQLSEKYNEIVNVSILELNDNETPQSVIVYKKSNPNLRLVVDPPLGSKSECYNSSVGKCLLAFTDTNLSIYSDDQMRAFTPNTITSWSKLQDHLTLVKKQGFAIDDEELEIGLCCIGAPIFDGNGKCIAAISLSGPTTRIKDSTFEEKIQFVKETADKISAEFSIQY